MSVPSDKPRPGHRPGRWAWITGAHAQDPVSSGDEGQLRGRLIGAGFWTISSFLVLSIANYIFTLALSRLLHIADYGSFGVVSSILLLEGLVSSSAFPWTLNMTIAALSGPDADLRLRTKALSTALIGNTVLGLVTGVVVALLTARLVAGHPLLPLLTGLAAFFTAVSAVWEGLFGGERRFALWSVLRMAEVIIKVALGIVLILIGFGLEAAMAAAIAGTMVAVVWGAVRLRRFSLPRRGEWWDTSSFRTVWWTALTQFGLALIMVIDLLSVRALGSGSQASVGSGYYQAANVLGRIPVFISIALQTAIFPFLAACRGDDEAETRLVRIALRVTVLIPVPMALILVAAPMPAMRFFFPPAFLPASDLLRLTALAGLPLIGLTLSVTLMQAIHEVRRAALAVLPGLAVETGILLIAVPRLGAIGAPWAVIAGATVGALLCWYHAARRWPTRTVAPSPFILVGLAFLGLTTAVIPMPGKSWPFIVAGLGTLFIVLLWRLGLVSADEFLFLTPQRFRPTLMKVIELEQRRVRKLPL